MKKVFKIVIAIGLVFLATWTAFWAWVDCR